MSRITLVALLCLAFVAGCATTNGVVPTKKELSQIVVGVTNMAEVTSKLGKPQDEKPTMEDEEEVWIYNYKDTHALNKAVGLVPIVNTFVDSTDTDIYVIKILFGSGGIVKNVEYKKEKTKWIW